MDPYIAYSLGRLRPAITILGKTRRHISSQRADSLIRDGPLYGSIPRRRSKTQ
jgi:hypothetical protein